MTTSLIPEHSNPVAPKEAGLREGSSPHPLQRPGGALSVRCSVCSRCLVARCRSARGLGRLLVSSCCFHAAGHTTGPSLLCGWVSLSADRCLHSPSLSPSPQGRVSVTGLVWFLGAPAWHRFGVCWCRCGRSYRPFSTAAESQVHAPASDFTTPSPTLVIFRFGAFVFLTAVPAGRGEMASHLEGGLPLLDDGSSGRWGDVCPVPCPWLWHRSWGGLDECQRRSEGTTKF